MITSKNIHKHPTILHTNDLNEICSPLSLLDIVYFSHVHIDTQGRFSALATQPDFFKLYVEKKYYNFDVHMLKLQNSEQYIIWDTISRTRESKTLHDDFMSFSQGHTFTIIQTNSDHSKDCFHFAARLGNNSINNQYLQHLDLLKKFILYYKDKIYRHKELKLFKNIKFDVAYDQGNYFTKNHLNKINAQNFLQAIHTDRIYFDNDHYLTKREFECMNWLSMGKTIEQIALILSITPRTVKQHINNIKTKLQCNTQFQLGVLYNQLNWRL